MKVSIFNLFVIVFIAIFPHLGLLSFFSMAYTIPVILLVWFNLKFNKQSFSDIGFNFKAISLKSFVVGGVFAILIFLFMQNLFFPLLDLFVDFKETEVDLYSDLRNKGSVYYTIIMILSWIVGGLYESVVFHAFTFTQLEHSIGGKYKVLLSFVITSLIFGLYHYQLGMADTINALIVGAFYLGLFLFFKRNLWYTIFCHGIYNSIVITLIHLGHL